MIEDPESDKELYKSAEEIMESISLDSQADGAVALQPMNAI